MECRACQLLVRGLGGFEQDEHYGGCIPLWVETEDIWAILSEPLSINEVTQDVEVLDIDTDHNDSEISDS
jgi:hypothetical protein